MMCFTLVFFSEAFFHSFLVSTDLISGMESFTVFSRRPCRIRILYAEFYRYGQS